MRPSEVLILPRLRQRSLSEPRTSPRVYGPGFKCSHQETIETPENSTVRFEEEERHARSTDRKTRQRAGALFSADPPQRSLPYCRAVAGDAPDPRCVYGGAGGGWPSLRAGFPGGGGRDFLSEGRRRAVTGCVRA